MMLGMAHRALGNWNLASTEFYRIRSTTHPLARWAAWYEAEADRERGRPQSAIAECTQIRTSWPTSQQAKECLLLMGDAWADRKNRVQAAAHFDQWTASHAGSPRIEEIQTRKALAITRASTAHGIPMLKRLVLDHRYHSSAEAAQQALDALGAKGKNVSIPDDTRTQIRRITSAQNCGRLDAGWEMFLKLKERTDDPQAQRWTSANEARIAKRTRQWGHYAAILQARYDAKPSASLAWEVFRAWSRAGQWDKVVAIGREGMTEYRRQSRWPSAADDLAWAEIHLGDYSAAADRWKTMADGRGVLGKRAQFYTSYCALHAGRLQEALTGFDKVIAKDRTWRGAAYYWRAKVKERLGDHDGAATDRSESVRLDRDGWYTALINGLDEHKATPARAHNGRWHGAPRPILPELTAPAEQALVSVNPRRKSTLDDPKAMPWPLTFPAQKAQTPPPAPSQAPTLVAIKDTVHDGYVHSSLFDPEEAAKSFKRFSSAKASIWPLLPAASDLAEAGMMAEAGVIVGEAYEEWKKWRKWKKPASQIEPTPARITSIRAVQLPIGTWRQYFALTRDHFHAAVASFGLGRKIKDPNESLAAYRLAYPLVEGPAMWDHGEAHNVDPLLMMGIMRQESTYRTTIKSHAGAIGLVQVMPATGARLAWLMGDLKYSPGALENPAINLRYGTYYMSLLLNRFDGVYPMAVASYNGGPHNVSRWVRNHLGKIEIDAWVEQVPWKETRNYVKKVVGHYSRYVELYGESDAALVLPDRPLGDDPTVVNF